MGKSLAMLGAVYGFQVIIVVDPKISSNLLKWYNAYGARVEMVKIQMKMVGSKSENSTCERTHITIS